MSWRTLAFLVAVCAVAPRAAAQRARMPRLLTTDSLAAWQERGVDPLLFIPLPF